MPLHESRQTRRTLPSASQWSIRRVLVDSQTPLTSSELARRVGMFSTEFQGACALLRINDNIQRELKRVKQQMGDARVFRRLAFWALTEKGHMHSRGIATGRSPSPLSASERLE